MTEMIQDLYPNALKRGIHPDLFWSSSIPELLDMMTSYDEVKESELKQEVELRFIHADAVATRIGFMFTDEKKRKKSDILQPWNAYPRLFEGEKELSEEVESKENLEQQKRAMEAYASAWRNRNGG